MARQQGLSDSARSVNLQAIQNLNSYMDGVQKLLTDRNINSKYPFPNEQHTVDIEFVIPMSPDTTTNTTTKTNNEAFVVSTSRRKLELLVPPMDMPPQKVQNYATRQFLKLLRISDLPVPAGVLYDDDDDEDYDEMESIGQQGAPFTQQKIRKRRPVSAWEASRERFWRRHRQSLNQHKFQKLYREALQDAQIHVRTRNWIRDNPKLRHKLLANILSNIKFTESISPLERLVAYRRLLRFLDENFDQLSLEDSGKYWEEQATILVGESRGYSPSSLKKLRNKKKRKHVETGYSFSVHHDNTVTVTIPIDFENGELLQELLRNMQDFLQTQGTGLEGDYYSAMYEDSVM